jgi:hypothetical protein
VRPSQTHKRAKKREKVLVLNEVCVFSALSDSQISSSMCLPKSSSDDNQIQKELPKLFKMPCLFTPNLLNHASKNDEKLPNLPNQTPNHFSPKHQTPQPLPLSSQNVPKTVAVSVSNKPAEKKSFAVPNT